MQDAWIPLEADNNDSALKGAIRDLLQSPHSAANRLRHVRTIRNCVQIMCATWYEGTAQLLSLTELKSHLFNFILLAEPLTDEGGEETGVPGENPRRRASKNATY